MSTEHCTTTAGEEEVWASVSGWEGWYEISTKGTVRSLDRLGGRDGKVRTLKGRIIRPRWNGGYWCVNLNRNGVGKQYLVHRLVLLTFRGDCPSGQEGRHLDGNVNNNQLSNLAWGTKKQNGQDRVRHGNTNSGRSMGKGNTRKLKEKVSTILNLWSTGNYSQSEIGRMMGVTHVTVGYHIRKAEKNARYR